MFATFTEGRGRFLWMAATIALLAGAFLFVGRTLGYESGLRDNTIEKLRADLKRHTLIVEEIKKGQVQHASQLLIENLQADVKVYDQLVENGAIPESSVLRTEMEASAERARQVLASP